MKNNSECSCTQLDTVNEAISKCLKIGGSIFTIFTAIGASLIILYLIQIRFVPDTGIADLTLLFLASAVVGFLLFFAVAAVPLVATPMWQIAINSIKKDFEKQDANIRQHFVLLWLCGPVFFFLLVILVSLIPNSNPSGPVISGILALIIIFLFAHTNFKVKYIDSVLYTFLILASGLVIILAVVIWILMSGEYLWTEGSIWGTVNVVVIGVCVIAVPTITLMIPDTFLPNQIEITRRIIWSSSMAVSVTVLLLFFTGSSNFTNTIARNLGVGGIKNARIVINTTGLGSTIIMGRTCVAEHDFCTIDDVDILWGRGDRYLLKIGNNEVKSTNVMASNLKQKQEKQIFFPKERILLIERLVKKRNR